MKPLLLISLLASCAYSPEHFHEGEDVEYYCSGDVVFEGAPPDERDVQWCKDRGFE